MANPTITSRAPDRTAPRLGQIAGAPRRPDVRQSEAPPAGGAGVPAGRLASLVEQISVLLDEESAAIAHHGPRDLERFLERKGQALVVLNRMAQTATAAVGEPGLSLRLHALSGALERNRRQLKIHMEAVAEVSQIIVRALESARSDGTYSQSGATGMARR